MQKSSIKKSNLLHPYNLDRLRHYTAHQEHPDTAKT